jgi:hypothetical protein
MNKEIVLFEMTRDGWATAKQYLKEIDKFEEFENNTLSLDGYSLVAYANYYKTLSNGRKWAS